MAARTRKRTIVVPLITVVVQDDGIHLVVRARINNRVARLVLDTGASRTVLDRGRAHKYLKDDPKKHDALSTGLGTSAMESFIACFKKVEIGDLRIYDYESVLLDLNHINVSLKQAGMKEIDGVLGGDILSAYGAVVDYGRQTLKLKG